MGEPLEVQARKLLDSAPASVELPAGTGKTHLLATAVKEAAKSGQRSLILTHTNAGVDAILKRLSDFQVSPKHYRIDTITGWAFTLARSYRTIAGVDIPEIPDWKQSTKYLSGAINVARTSCIKEVMGLSYDYLLVDEYQDCTKKQHDLILALKASIFKTIVLGDPLQSIFGFREPLVEWKYDVQITFPDHMVKSVPHRWKDTNPALGKFTLEIRHSLSSGNLINFGNYAENGVFFIPLRNNAIHTIRNSCYSLTRNHETVAVLTSSQKSEDIIAGWLGGRFNVIEPITSKRMTESLEKLPPEGSPDLACWFALNAKKYHVGLKKIDQPLIKKLKEGKSVKGLTRKGLQEFITALTRLQEIPSYKTLLDIQEVPQEIEGVNCPYREAWRDIFRAIQFGVDEESPDMIANLGVIRSRYKHMERRMPNLIVSRTLIVKGLEFDHVVIYDLANFSDPRHLYVALSRAKKSVTILSASPTIQLKKSN